MSSGDTHAPDCGCGCCQTSAPTPVVANRPGLPALRYRIGTQPTFLRQMLERLPAQSIPEGGPGAGTRPLLQLTTRGTDDPAIALVDAWATALDVLTFYQERIANEGYLRTATERLSVLELARATGYELSPGVAAAAYLAFTLDDAPGSPAQALVPVGTRVQSVPAPGEKPQTFETTENLTAHPEWNAVPAAATVPQTIGRGLQALYLQGIATQLQSGDAILVVGDERAGASASDAWDFRILTGVEPNPAAGYTRVTFAKQLGGRAGSPALKHPRVYALRQHAGIFGHNAPDWNSMSTDFQTSYTKGHPSSTTGEWPNFALGAQGLSVELDAAYPKLLNGGWVVVTTAGAYQVQLFYSSGATIRTHAEFALSGRTTTLALDKAFGVFKGANAVQGRRSYTVYAQSEQLPLADLPVIQPSANGPVVTAPVQADSVTLQRRVDALSPGQLLALTGKRVRARVISTVYSVYGSPQPQVGDLLLTLAAPVPGADGTVKWALQDKNGVQAELRVPAGVIVAAPAEKDDLVVSAVVPLLSTTSEAGRTVLKLQQQLASWYDPTTVTVALNVARATHGETVKEVLGSGDATSTNQRFVLKKPPLTYVSAPTASGGASTLVLRVDGVQWDEQPSLYGLDPQAQSYTVRTGADGKATVIFGDGQMGARLSTGQENLVASYRSGIGTDGNVGARSLSLLQTRPQGVQQVINPLPARGGSDPESLQDARANAPFKVLTLERIVSLQDYEDFARAFSGIGKAKSEAIWAGTRRIVHLTVMDSQGGPIAPTAPVFSSLLSAIRDFGDPTQQVQVSSYRPASFSFQALLITDSRYETEAVLAAANQALTGAFAWPQRSFGQAVSAAELMTILQGVPGVVAVELTGLQRDDAPGAGPVPALLGAARAAWKGGSIAPAELLLLNPKGAFLSQRTTE